VGGSCSVQMVRGGNERRKNRKVEDVLMAKIAYRKDPRRIGEVVRLRGQRCHSSRQKSTNFQSRGSVRSVHRQEPYTVMLLTWKWIFSGPKGKGLRKGGRGVI